MTQTLHGVCSAVSVRVRSFRCATGLSLACTVHDPLGVPGVEKKDAT